MAPTQTCAIQQGTYVPCSPRKGARRVIVPFVERLRATFAEHANRPAVIHRDCVWTYADVAARSMRLAGRLQRLGLSPGDRVALLLADRLPCVIAQLGVLLAGGVAL